jgi:potassium-transporting ATPase KdpC subunit
MTACAIRLFVTMTVIAGVLYPVVITIAGRLLFPYESSGSLLYNGASAIGSRLLAQPAKDSGYFFPRPSAGNYATVPSASSNLAVTSAALHDSIRMRARNWGETIGNIPSDLLFSSGSGLDPHISLGAALFQINRIARVRGFSAEKVGTLKRMIAREAQRPQFGLLGDSRVNVLLLNCGLDGIQTAKPQ